MSISKAQAAAIADGFLDQFGSGKEGLAPRNTFTEFILIAGELIESAQANLNSSSSNASGKLSESLIANEPVLQGNELSIDVTMNFYGRFVNKGVKGTRSGSSTAGYQFKTDMPSKKMVSAISEWKKNAASATSNVSRSYGKHERKNLSIKAASSAFAIARSVKMYGLKPTGFLDKAIDSTRKKVASRLGNALKIDLIDSLKST